eukprot:CAMPEP_0172200134 /NCGR_PEP_ID=MMETSP1050-20130122/29129_1 /TAXON_ID=233186 /ORGANISM="Cryptomonas curvata, Strain CCAP979/52" /LENGTH=115 /DNA_ID=CAMNT_0012877343 /DNA_START=144 /DNA_END=487 /DNA_ORIENTATION=+
MFSVLSGSIILLQSEDYLCIDLVLKISVSNIVIKGPELKTVLESRNASIMISASNVTLQSVDFVGIWSILIGPNSSLTLNQISTGQAIVINATNGGNLTIDNSTVSRQVPSATAL